MSQPHDRIYTTSRDATGVSPAHRHSTRPVVNNLRSCRHRFGRLMSPCIGGMKTITRQPSWPRSGQAKPLVIAVAVWLVLVGMLASLLGITSPGTVHLVGDSMSPTVSPDSFGIVSYGHSRLHRPAFER